MQRYTEITENHSIEESRQLLLDNDMTSITNNAGVNFPEYGMAGTTCFRADQQRLFILRVDGQWQMIADATKTALSREEADQRYSTVTHNHDTVYAPRQSSNRPGVTKLYRSDSDQPHNIQVSWTGSYWKLQGYNGETPHSGVLVDRATSAATADNTGKLGGVAASNWLRSNTNQTFSAALTITGNVTMQSNLTVSGDVTSSSDIRLKSDIETIEDALQKVESLRGVSYRHKQTNQKNIGFVAQEVQKIVPDVVRVGEDKKLSVAYGNITALLVEAVKELALRVKKLEAGNGV